MWREWKGVGEMKSPGGMGGKERLVIGVTLMRVWEEMPK